jgi:hypothetical protein
MLEVVKGKILDASCTCKWMTYNRNAWKESKQICKHLKDIMENKKKDKNGYVLVYLPNYTISKTKKGWILEHRAVVETFLNRSLKVGECIHHIDFNRHNNKIDNLMLFKSHKEHASFHNKLKQFGITNPIKKQINERWKNAKP